MNWIKRLIENFLYQRQLKRKLKQARREDPYIYK